MARVMVVDDALFMRATVKKLLTGAGYEVVGEAENGRVAVELFAQLKPDLVLMDITMPEKDGLEALHDIIAADPAARVVMCSALGQQDKIREALMTGAKDYVVKPYTPDKLLDTIKRVLA